MHHSNCLLYSSCSAMLIILDIDILVTLHDHDSEMELKFSILKLNTTIDCFSNLVEALLI